MFFIDYLGKLFVKMILIFVVFIDIKVKVKEIVKVIFLVREKFIGYVF